MFATRYAGTAHALMSRLTTWCRQQGWKDERRVADCCSKAAVLALVDGHPTEAYLAGRLASRVDQVGLDLLNDASRGVTRGPWHAWWRVNREKVLDRASMVVAACAAVTPMLMGANTRTAAGVALSSGAVLAASSALRFWSRGSWSLPAVR